MGHRTEVFVGIDTSKSRNAIAIADGGRGGEVRYLGELPATEAAIRKLVAKLAAKYRHLTLCYEAGPTGYGLYRLLKSLGHECPVVAPSLVPKKAGDRVKTNRRDAVSLAKLCARASSPSAPLKWRPMIANVPTNVRDLHGALENFDRFRSQVEAAASRKFDSHGFGGTDALDLSRRHHSVRRRGDHLRAAELRDRHHLVYPPRLSRDKQPKVEAAPRRVRADRWSDESEVCTSAAWSSSG